MKTLIVYFTRTNTTKIVAKEIGKKINATVEEIKDGKNWSGVTGFLKAGRAAMKKSLTDNSPIANRIEEYDMVVIGSPVWAGTLPPAIRTFVTDNKTKFKKVAFFTTQGGENKQRIFSDFAELLGSSPVVEMFVTTKQVKSGMIEGELSAFVQKIQ